MKEFIFDRLFLFGGFTKPDMRIMLVQACSLGHTVMRGSICKIEPAKEYYRL
jgi:hypothetical protein